MLLRRQEYKGYNHQAKASKQVEKPVERLIKLSKKRDRSINYLVVEAMMEYLKQEEAKEI